MQGALRGLLLNRAHGARWQEAEAAVRGVSMRWIGGGGLWAQGGGAAAALDARGAVPRPAARGRQALPRLSRPLATAAGPREGPQRDGAEPALAQDSAASAARELGPSSRLPAVALPAWDQLSALVPPRLPDGASAGGDAESWTVGELEGAHGGGGPSIEGGALPAAALDGISPAPSTPHAAAPAAARGKRLTAAAARAARARATEAAARFARCPSAKDRALAIFVNAQLFPKAARDFGMWLGEAAIRSGDLRDRLAEVAGLRRREATEALFPLFARHVLMTRRDEVATYRSRCAAADLRAPHAWYPVARSGPRRRVIYHAGPTNSGKTWQALEAMSKATSGVYAGPLRLLAMEVYDATNARGTRCDLVTGQERVEVPGSTHSACTVEMVDLSAQYDVAVLDEIQMLGDPSRGWAWTRALVGLPARELHVCGDASAAEVVRKVCEATGDELEVREYTRLTPLRVEHQALDAAGGYSSVRPGDCIVAFSRRDIFEIRRAVETRTGHRAAVVYGALPPETRRAQAARFNDPASGHDVLVASDAVGMGLNLNIGRVIFSTLEKYEGGGKTAPVSVSMVKQIAGRAGRRGSTFGPGRATTLRPGDLAGLRAALAVPLADLVTPRAGVFPEYEHLELFASQQPGSSFRDVLEGFADLARLDSLYFLCRQDGVLEAASLLEDLPLSLRDTYTFCVAPASLGDPRGAAALRQFASRFAAGSPVPLELSLPDRAPRNDAELRHLEAAHGVASLWLWLARRYDDGHAFPGVAEAEQLAASICQMLDEGLAKISARERGEDGEASPPEAVPATSPPTQPVEATALATGAAGGPASRGAAEWRRGRKPARAPSPDPALEKPSKQFEKILDSLRAETEEELERRRRRTSKASDREGASADDRPAGRRLTDREPRGSARARTKRSSGRARRERR